jgi:hypothetical protein
MDDYEKQAQDFLTETGTTLTITFKKHDFYLEEEKSKRDIYEITLKRGSRFYTFDFGQSLSNSKLNIEPTTYDVLASLTTDEPDLEKFEEFCASYGYDSDSRNAEKTYLALVEEHKNLKMLFTDAELEKLGEIN